MTADRARDGTPGGAADESSPLLAGNSNSNTTNHHKTRRPRRPPHRPTLSVASLASSLTIPQAHDHTTFITLLCILIVAANAAGGFIEIPMARLVEDGLCRQYYEGGYTGQDPPPPLDEAMCKVEPVQSKMAYLLALMSALDAIVGFCAAFPWSLVADRVGRKPVMSLGLAGLSLAVFWIMLVLALPGVFPVSLICLGSLSQLIGGGSPMLAASIYSMLTDATTDGERAVVFLRVHVASLCGMLFAPSLASLLMERTGPWPSMWLGAGLLVTCAVTVLFLPETFKKQPPLGLEAEGEGEGETTTTTATTAGDSSGGQQQTTTSSNASPTRRSHLAKQFQHAVALLKSPSLVLLLVACLVTSSTPAATSAFMVQFVSRRYQVKLEHGGYIQSFYGLAQAIQSLVVLPWLSKKVVTTTRGRRHGGSSSRRLFRWPADAHQRDLFLLRGSSACVVAAALVLGLAPTLAVFLSGLALLALGTGCGSLIRTLLSLYVDPAHRSRLFGLVAMVEIVGDIYARPMLAALFSLGMKLSRGDQGWGEVWWLLGLPYYGVAALFAATTVLFVFVRVPPKDPVAVGPSSCADHEEVS